MGTFSDVSLQIAETDLSILTASIRAPSGHEEPCLLKRLPNRHIGVWPRRPLQVPGGAAVNPTLTFCLPCPAGISFTPKEVGEHVVSVRKGGKHVTNSPFRIAVGQSEIGDASRVKVKGRGLVEGHTLEVADFIVDTRTAGECHSPLGGGGSRVRRRWGQDPICPPV